MKERTIDTLPLDGGWLCLNFINTVHDYTEEEPADYLSDYYDFLAWSVRVGILSMTARKELEFHAMNNKDLSEKAFSQIIEARKTLYDYFHAIVQNRIPDDNSQLSFNSYLSEAMVNLKLKIVTSAQVQLQWQQNNSMEYPLYPIFKSAYDLLTSEILDRVKECGECGWLFLDQSKNKSRKWCSMESCGSNVKAKRYYHKKKKNQE